jgi:hypothetical protein
MILTITDDSGESVYSDIKVASFDAASSRVTFLVDHGTEQARSLTVSKGTVRVIEGSALVAEWHPNSAPPDGNS